jgi:Flp pilus assembly protein TadB
MEMASEATLPHRISRQDAGRWLRVLAPPMVWALQQQANFSLTATVCEAGTEAWLHVIMLAALAAVIGTALLSWMDWKSLPEGSTDQAEPPDTRSRFMAVAGMGLGVFFVLVIVATDLPNWFLGACQK